MNLVKLSIVLLITATTTKLSAQLSSQEFAFLEMAESTEQAISNGESEAIHTSATFSDLKQQLSYKINYPASMMPYEIEGISTVKITISKQGKIDDFEIIESLGSAFDFEINSILQRVDTISPVLFNGVPKNQTIVFPIQFRL